MWFGIDWRQPDKQLHSGLGAFGAFFMSVALMVFSVWDGGPAPYVLAVGLAVVLLVTGVGWLIGYAKEEWDKGKANHASDPLDLRATWLGALLGAVLGVGLMLVLILFV